MNKLDDHTYTEKSQKDYKVMNEHVIIHETSIDCRVKFPKTV